jgi:hypothetical protein
VPSCTGSIAKPWGVYTETVSVRAWIRREAYVVAHGQTARFRAAKYLVLLGIGVALRFWIGWKGVLTAFACVAVLGLILHFLFRWKTKGWTESWGLYKKMDLPR